MWNPNTPLDPSLLHKLSTVHRKRQRLFQGVPTNYNTSQPMPSVVPPIGQGMAKGGTIKPPQVPPGHVNHLRNLLRSSVSPSSQVPHPLIVPPPATSISADSSGGDDQIIPAKTGEYVIPKAVVDRKGTQFFDNLVKKTLSEIMPPDQANQGGTGTPETGFRWGGEVENDMGRFRNIQQAYSPRPLSVRSVTGGERISPGNINDRFDLPTGGAGSPDTHGVVITPRDVGPLAVNPYLYDPTGPEQSPLDNSYDPGQLTNQYLGPQGQPWTPTNNPNQAYDPYGYPYASPVAGPPAAIWTDPSYNISSHRESS